jgi:hypothetical protein
VNKTPIYAEDLLAILSKSDAMDIAGYNGTCQRFIRYDAVVSGLQKLVHEGAQVPAHTKGEKA